MGMGITSKQTTIGLGLQGSISTCGGLCVPEGRESTKFFRHLSACVKNAFSGICGCDVRHLCIATNGSEGQWGALHSSGA